MAAASLGRLTLDLLVKLGSFEQGMTQAERKAKQTADNMGKAFTGFKSQISDALSGTQIGSIIDGFNSKIGSIQGNVLVAGAAIAGMAVGGVAVGIGALAKMAIETAKADAQLQVLANRANTSVKNFQVLEYAASGLGVSQDQLGSILADVQEKLGEFSATAGGGAADFFDALKNNTKMTDDQIKAFGKTLQGKDGVAAIQMLNDKMDELGVTSQERRFIFESLASDLGNLAPIFARNAELLKEFDRALEQAGVLRSAEAMQQSQLLAAQTQSLQTRFEGVKNQLTAQMMPALNGLISYFLKGAKDGVQFGGVISSVGTIAKGVGAVIIGLAGGIELIINQMKNFLAQSRNIGHTAVNVWNADGFLGKSAALIAGVSSSVTMAQSSFTDSFAILDKTVRGATGMFDSIYDGVDDLSKVYLKANQAAQEAAKGIKTNTKEADENAKATEKQAAAKAKLAKESANLNKIVGASALSGLRIKSSEAFAGGGIRGYTADFAQLAQKQLGSVLNRFTAFNDLYHKGTNSKHATGNAFDFTIADVTKSTEAVSQLENVAKRYGYVVKILDEYRNPSSRATGGHLHVSVLGFKGSADAAKQAQDELSLVAQTNEEAARIQAETQKAQQSIVFQYLSEREKMEVEHGAKILEIQKAFAGDDSAIQKYTDLQNAAYKKDVTEYESQQKLKQIAEQKTLLEVRKNWMTVGSYAQDYYALVREEILATAEYSPDMKHALIKQSNAQEGMEQNAEREQTWSDFQNRFEAPNYYQQDADLLKAARDQMLITEDEYQKQRLALQVGYGNEYLGALSGMFGAMLGESSSTYKALFFAQRSFYLAQAGMNVWKSASDAYANEPGTVWQKMGAAALATIESGTFISLIEAATPVGMAHNGIDNIPSEGTWLLDGGERVLNPQQNKDLTNYLANQNSSGGGDVKIQVNITDSGVNTSGGNSQDQKQLGQMIGHAVRAVIRQEQRQGGLLAK